MTVTNATLESSLFSGNGVTTAFATGFQFDNEADIQVILRASDGTETIQTLTTHYTVSGEENPAGGTVTMVTPPAVGERLRIVRNLSYTQGTDYTEGTAFPSETHEGALDKLTQLTQQLAHELNRAPKLKTTSSNYPAEFPDGGADKAGFIFRWNTPAGTSLEAVDPVDAITGAETTTFSRDLLADASAAEARSTLGVVIGTDVQAYDAQLADVAGLTPSDGNFIVGDGTNFVAESGATARASLGLGTLATQDGTFSGTSSGSNTGDQNLFGIISVAGQSDVVADSANDTLTLEAGSNVTITTNAATDTITISATGGGGGGTPGGSNTQIQFNNSGSFGGSADLTWDGSQLSTSFVDVGSGANINDVAVYDQAGTMVVATTTKPLNIIGNPSLKLNNIQWPSSDGTNGQVLVTNGSGVTSWSSSTRGKVLQVVQVVKTDTFSTASTSFVDITGMSASITPSSTSSKILVLVDIKFNSGGNTAQTVLVRGSTAIYRGDVAGSRIRSSAMDRTNETTSNGSGTIMYLDSPSTTSSTTYKIQGLTNAGTFYVNRSSLDTDGGQTARTASSITLMEIGA